MILTHKKTNCKGCDHSSRMTALSLLALSIQVPRAREFPSFIGEKKKQNGPYGSSSWANGWRLCLDFTFRGNNAFALGIPRACLVIERKRDESYATWVYTDTPAADPSIWTIRSVMIVIHMTTHRRNVWSNVLRRCLLKANSSTPTIDMRCKGHIAIC